MAIAARYGGMQPSEFEAMDFEEAQIVAEHCQEMAHKEFEATAELHMEIGKATMRGMNDTMSAIARGMSG